MNVPFIDLQAQYRSLKREIDAAVLAVLDSGRYVGGRDIECFEDEFAAYCGVPHAVGCASGTAALQLALLAAGVGHGDEVITVANSFAATVEAILHVGATPVFVDVVESTGNMEPSQIPGVVTPCTKAIVPVHLHGQCADMEGILTVGRQYELKVIEDAAQAHGATMKGRKAGAWGDLACFSFYPGKNLGACGEAGIVTTASEKMKERISLLASHGERPKNVHIDVGFNHRLDAIQAAILRVKLRRLETWNLRRRQLVSLYMTRLGGHDTVILPSETPESRSVYHHFVVRIGQRDRIAQQLAMQGIHTMIHYPVPLDQQPAFARVVRVPTPLPVTRHLSAEILTLPLFPEMTESQVDFVADSLLQHLEN